MLVTGANGHLGRRLIRHLEHAHVRALVRSERAASALRSGRRLYEEANLVRYIQAEVELIERVRPALVVGDFRWSVPASAELCGVPSAVLINAYWSPYAPRPRFPVPDHPIVRVLGERLTEQYFPLALPRVFQHFADPLNRARARFGLRPVGSLLEVLTHADHTLYPDDPWLTPAPGAPASHRFIGPVLWQPDVSDAGLLPHAGGNERALDMVIYGSDYLLALAGMAPDAFARRDALWASGNPGFHELNDLLQYLGSFAFRNPVAAYRHAAAMFLELRGWIGSSAVFPGAPVRPESDREVLREIAQRVATL